MSKAKNLIALVLVFGLLFSTIAYAATGTLSSARCVVHGSTAAADSDGLAQTISDDQYDEDDNITIMVHGGSDVGAYNATLEIVGTLPWSNSSTYLRMQNNSMGANTSTWLVEIDDIPEGIYSVRAKMTNMTNFTNVYEWAPSDFINATAMRDGTSGILSSATCTAVSFTVGGDGVNLLPQQIEELTTPQKDNTGLIVVIALAAIVIYYFTKKK